MLSTNVALHETPLGASRLSDGSWEFLLWAPYVRSANVHIVDLDNGLIPMESLGRGYHYAAADAVQAGSRYFYRLDDNRELPDPASRFQPEGVHGPSQLVNTHAFSWTDQHWTGISLENTVFYELHVGTYTAEGSFDALIRHLPELVELGVTTLELMPIAQFPGARNWGYDGVYPFAPQNSYGGPESLFRLVNAAHEHGLAVALDVVYNHLGPEGNYLGAYGPYFTDRYSTPWGQAINFDGENSDEVRRFFIENALYWLEDYHFDALRLDAIHGIFDFGACHLLAELKSAVAKLAERLGRKIHLIAESDLNDSRVLRDPAQGGYGLDAQWSDDFHHSVHTLLTREKLGYYADFEGIESLVATLRDGWYYSGQYSQFRKRRHGNSPSGIAASRFVICNQNHDQVGNRALGERLNSLASAEATKLAAGLTLLSPFTPLLFMGEEYGEIAPFQYFTSHGDPALIESVRRGRRDEFAAFDWRDSVPDPQSEETFARSRLDHALKSREPHKSVLRFYQQLLHIRREYELGTPAAWTVFEVSDRALVVLRRNREEQFAVVCHFGDDLVVLNVPQLAGKWKTVIHSAAREWLGPVDNVPTSLQLQPPCEIRLFGQSFLALERNHRSTEAV